MEEMHNGLDIMFNLFCDLYLESMKFRLKRKLIL